MTQGIEAVAGAIDFVRSLIANVPKAVASSSSTRWVRAISTTLAWRTCSGRTSTAASEHVEQGKPHPDLYLHAAQALGIEFARR